MNQTKILERVGDFERIGLRRQDVARSTMSIAFFSAVMTTVFSQSFDNFLPDSVRFILELLLVLFISVFIFMFFARGMKKVSRFVIGTTWFIFVFIAAIGTDSSHIMFAIRYIFSISSFLFIVERDSFTLSRRMISVLRFTAITCSLFVVAYAFLGPHIVVGTARLAVFNGGDDGLHPSAYAVFGLLFLNFALGPPEGKLLRPVFWATICALVAAGLAFQVRTALVVASVVVGVLFVPHSPRYKAVEGFFYTYAVVFAFAAVMVTLADSSSIESLSRFSSGRVDNYIERLGIISGRDALNWLFGTGPGTDAFRGSTSWRFEAKNSHNDILMMFIEVGFIGLLSVACYLFTVFKDLEKRRLALALGLISSSFISNGIIFRTPICALYVFSIVMLGRKR